MWSTQLALLVAGAPFALISCTFPGVDYVSTASNNDAGVCILASTSTCAFDAPLCGNQATQARNDCVNQCTIDTCKAECDATFESAHASCVSACESCALSQCDGQPTDCASLVGT